MYKMDNIAVPGGVMSIEAPTIKDLWKEAAFLQAIPHTCPVDGSPTRFGYKEPGAFKYWVLFSTGERVFEFKFGQDAASGELFPGSYDKKTDETHRRWTWWDWQNKREIVVWEDGQLTAEGRKLMGGAPVPSGIYVDDDPSRYPESLDEVEELAGGTVENPFNESSVLQIKLINALGSVLYQELWHEIHNMQHGEAAQRIESLEATGRKMGREWVAKLEGAGVQFEKPSLDKLSGQGLVDALQALRRVRAASAARQVVAQSSSKAGVAEFNRRASAGRS